MKILIGHRGVGKTTLLKLLPKALANLSLPTSTFVDLDRYIEERFQTRIATIFEQHGENYFRQIEKQCLLDLAQQSPTPGWVALGAGFNGLHCWPTEITDIIWIQRPSDNYPRYFFDRPPLANYQERILVREVNYSHWATEIWEFAEGLSDEAMIQKIQDWILPGPPDQRTALTLLPWHLSHPKRLENWITRPRAHYLEIRTDLLTLQDLTRIPKALLYKFQWILAIRNEDYLGYLDYFSQNKMNFKIDVDQTLQAKKFLAFDILSSHNHQPPQLEAHSSSASQWLKWSPLLDSPLAWDQAHQWQARDPQRRLLMPRTLAQWMLPASSSWMRSYLASKQPLTFVRDTRPGSYEGQLNAAYFDPIGPQWQAAVLGHPVQHSYSPSFHHAWASAKQGHFYAIDCQAHDLEMLLKALTPQGFKYFAVTAPLKKELLKLKNIQTSKNVQTFQSANTVTLKGQELHLYNTDIAGLIYSLLHQTQQIQLSPEEFVSQFVLPGSDSFQPELNPYLKLLHELSSLFFVYGGGGLLPLLKWALPNAFFHPVRQMQESPRHSSAPYFIWAANFDSPWPKTQFGPTTQLIDLNYASNSPARALAFENQWVYHSGLLFFQTQAIAQQKIWG